MINGGHVLIGGKDGRRDVVPGSEKFLPAPAPVPAPTPNETWLHGRRGPITFSGDRPAFFTRDRNAAEWYSREGGKPERGSIEFGAFGTNRRQKAEQSAWKIN
jgi:hypothetical protein